MKFLKKNKKLIIAFMIISTLLELLLVGVVMNLVKLGDEVAVEEFGGETVLALDFEKPSSQKQVSDLLTRLEYGEAFMKVGSFSEGNGSFKYYVPAKTPVPTHGAGNDSHVRFGKFGLATDDFSVITMDFDVKIISDGGAKASFNLDVREKLPDGSIPGRNNANSRVVYQDGVFKLEALDGNVFTYEGKQAHFTYVINHEKTLIYIDGKLFSEAGRMYEDGEGGVKTFVGFRMAITNCINKPEDITIVVDNIVVNKFAPDYTGNIHKLFANPDKHLKKNSDTIFGGTFKWPEE